MRYLWSKLSQQKYFKKCKNNKKEVFLLKDIYYITEEEEVYWRNKKIPSKSSRQRHTVDDMQRIFKENYPPQKDKVNKEIISLRERVSEYQMVLRYMT